MPEMEEIELHIKSLSVDPGNINEKIDELMKDKKEDALNSVVPDASFWVVPLQDQIDGLSESWSNPSSSMDGKIFYKWMIKVGV